MKRQDQVFNLISDYEFSAHKYLANDKQEKVDAAWLSLIASHPATAAFRNGDPFELYEEMRGCIGNSSTTYENVSTIARVRVTIIESFRAEKNFTQQEAPTSRLNECFKFNCRRC